MKAATCAFAVSVLTATTAALATTTTSAADGVFREGNPSNLKGKDCVISLSEKEKFAPRFDGLRFIETLVTAHR